MTARATRTATLVLIALASVLTRASAAEWHELLAKPLSPGSVALLVEHAADPRVAARWAEALKDARPALRAAAARAINVTRAVPLAEELTAAHAVETDPVARAEEAAALAALADAGALAPPTPPARPATWRIASGYPPELVPDVVRVSGCPAANKEDFHGGQVAYGPDGRPRRVALLEPTGVPAACEAAARALLFLSLAPAEAVGLAGRTDLVIVPFARDVVACLGAPLAAAAQAPPALSVGDTVKEPKKVRHLNPWYPAAAQAARVQGAVVLEAVVSPTGCIRELKVLRSVDPRLDLVSLLTVAHWRYTPTVIKGTAVPVIMTVTVNFRLS